MRSKMSKLNKIALLLLISNIVIIITSVSIMAYAAVTKLNSQTLERQGVQRVIDVGVVCFAAGISVVGGCIGAGVALKAVATAGAAAVTEKPELRTFVLIFGGLAEGIAIYGLLVAMIILSKI